MIKFAHLAVAALAVAAMTAAVSADDVVVKAPAGEGIVTLSEAEETSVTTQELKEILKGALENTQNCNLLLDAKANISLDMGTGEEMPITGSVIATMDKNGDAAFANLNYWVNLFGEESDGTTSAYMWKNGDKWRSAVEDGENWSVTETAEMGDPIEELCKALDEIDEQTLSALVPKDHLYEADGKKYYVCVADKEGILGTASGIEAAADYMDMANSIIGDNNLQIILAIDAETGFPYVISADASGAAGSLPGAIFGAETDLSYSCSNLYVSVFFDKEAAEIDIPEDVLSAEVSDAGAELTDMLGSLMDEAS